MKMGQVVRKGLELGRQIAVDLEPDADFNKHWRCPSHGFVLRFAAVVATDGYVTDHIYRKKWVTRGTLSAQQFLGTQTRASEVKFAARCALSKHSLFAPDRRTIISSRARSKPPRFQLQPGNHNG
jgi:hypothetical protein